MPNSALALLLLTPFIAVFAYAAWHEWHRAREDGHSNYGLAYDPETDTTHVTLLEEGEAGYDPEAATDEDGEDDSKG
jgi:hypothetical protein